MDDELRTGYEEALREFRIAFSRGGAYTGVVLVLLGVGLDFALYPHKQTTFALVRLLVSTLIFCMIPIMQTEWGKDQIRWLTFVWLSLPQIMIAWMIAETDGAVSLYSSGLHLAIYASGIVLAFGMWQNIVFGAMTYALYFVACAAHPESFVMHGAFVVNSMFLLFSATISAVFTFFNEQARMTLFMLKAEVAKKNRQLEQKNKALANIKGQLLQQEKMAAIGTLAAGLLHEVNNPLNFCLMAIDIAAEETAAKTSRLLSDCLADARKGMQRVQCIVSDLKTFAYRKANDAHDAQFLFAKALESAVRLTGYELKGVTVTQRLPADTLVSGDEASVVGVLINLLSNAAIAMREARTPRPEIQVSAAWRAERLHVTVRDNGPGIAPENLTRVFEPFFTTRDVGQGLGLGLSISYSVIERHGGTLVAESAPGQWTQMLFDLPRNA